jgi:hypothetical protein
MYKLTYKDDAGHNGVEYYADYRNLEVALDVARTYGMTDIIITWRGHGTRAE